MFTTLALTVGMSIPRASAQLTNGTILGSVRDAQSAAVVSATVSLLSETRGTRLPNVTTTGTGEFAIPNVPPDTYTRASTASPSAPFSNRNFTSLTAVLAGVTGTTRVGDQTSYSGGNANIMMDGVSTMDSGNNAVAISVNTEAIA